MIPTKKSFFGRLPPSWGNIPIKKFFGRLPYLVEGGTSSKRHISSLWAPRAPPTCGRWGASPRNWGASPGYWLRWLVNNSAEIVATRNICFVRTNLVFMHNLIDGDNHSDCGGNWWHYDLGNDNDRHDHNEDGTDGDVDDLPLHGRVQNDDIDNDDDHLD